MTTKAKNPVLDNKTQIAERLKKAREGLGLTQQQVADKAGVSRSAVVHYEKANVIPGGQELIGLAKALKKSPNYLLSGSETFFASAAPEHALVLPDSDPNVRVAIMAICMQALEREVAEALSSLALVLVKTRLPPRDYAEMLRNIQAIAKFSAGMAPEIEEMVDKASKAGAFDSLMKSPSKPVRKSKVKGKK